MEFHDRKREALLKHLNKRNEKGVFVNAGDKVARDALERLDRALEHCKFSLSRKTS